MRMFLFCLTGALLVACSSSDDDSPSPTTSSSSCEVEGTYSVTASYTSKGGAFCDDFAKKANAAAKAKREKITRSGSKVTSTDLDDPNDTPDTGTLDEDACSATFPETKTVKGTTTVSITGATTYEISDDKVSGDGSFQVTTTPAQPGTPCEITVTVSGERE